MYIVRLENLRVPSALSDFSDIHHLKELTDFGGAWGSGDRLLGPARRRRPPVTSSVLYSRLNCWRSITSLGGTLRLLKNGCSTP